MRESLMKVAEFEECSNKDWSVRDYKSIADRVIVKKLPFKTQPLRVMVFTKDITKQIGVSETYTGDPVFCAVTTGLKNFTRTVMNANLLPESNHVSQAKLADTKKLLNYIDMENEENAAYFRKVELGVVAKGNKEQSKPLRTETSNYGYFDDEKCSNPERYV